MGAGQSQISEVVQINETRQDEPFLVEEEEDGGGLSENGGEGIQYKIENHYAVFSFYDDYQCLSRGEVFLVLQLDGDYQQVGPQKLKGIDNELLKISGEEYKVRITGEDREKVCRTIMDSIYNMGFYNIYENYLNDCRREEV